MDTGKPQVKIIEEGMREGMQIESAHIPVADKIRLLDALSETGLKTIVVGSFVSPKWTPQMAEIDELVSRFKPNPEVCYTALALNKRGAERRKEYMPPLRAPDGGHRTMVHLCDVFVQRNTNRTQSDEIARWSDTVDRAVNAGVTKGAVAVNAAWGSNWLGPFSEEYRLDMLARQVELWHGEGLPVSRVWLGDPMAWNTPWAVASTLQAIQERWPEIDTFHLHLHNARGSALVSAYKAIESLAKEHSLILDSSIGGKGGCPYCGHGRMTRMIPTEDLVDMLEEMGIKTGVDLDRLIEVVHLAEEIVGHELWGHVSKAGPRPRGDRLFAMDMPFIETSEQAQHFRVGPAAYAGAEAPWSGSIVSEMRTAKGVLNVPFQGSSLL